MSKNKRKEKMRQARQDLPELKVWTIDVLASLADDDLYTLLLKLEDERSKLLRQGHQDRVVNRWETELCYVSRELDIRQTRRKAHAEWLAEMGAVGNDQPAN